MNKHKKNRGYYWIRITDDRYELPMMVAESAVELARMTGVALSTIYSAENRHRLHGVKSRYVRVRKE